MGAGTTTAQKSAQSFQLQNEINPCTLKAEKIL
jgi:hypothetical protein